MSAITKHSSLLTKQPSIEEFRKLITQIGNTLGFVRMIRAGAIESCVYSANFLPSIENEKDGSFENLVRESSAEEVKEAAHILNSVINNIHGTFNNTNDYIEVSWDRFL